MKKNIFGIILVLGYHAIWGISVWKYQTSNWVYLFPLILSAITLSITFWPKKQDLKSLKTFQETFHSIIEEQNTKEGISQDRIKELEKERDEIENTLDDINKKLNQENISKKELIKDLKDDLEVVVLIKHTEGERGQSVPRQIKESLKRKGFRSINYGMYILPPYLSPNFKDSNQMNNWIEKNFLKKIDETYRYKMSVMVVDLKKVLVKEQGDTQMKSIIEKLNFTDIVRLEKLNEYVRKKKEISLMDIIQIPKLTRLVETGHYGLGDKKTLSEKNDEVSLKIAEAIGKEELKTKDISSISKDNLINILESFNIRKKEEIATDILNNSKFWLKF